MQAFISHSHQDEAQYSALSLALDGAGVSRWDVTELSPGSSLADQLRIAIEQCGVCIFLATRRSIEAPWCLAELGAFWGAGKRVIVYLADPDVAKEKLPPQFQGNLWTTNAKQLLDTVKQALNTASHSLELRKIQGNYHTQDSRHYVVTFSHRSNGIYRLSNVDWWGLGQFDGRVYHGMFRYIKHESGLPPSNWGGDWGLHRAELDRIDGSLKLYGVELNGEQVVKTFSGRWFRSDGDGARE